MPIRKVHLIPGHYYHIYNKAVADNLLFIEEKNYHFFLSKVKKYLSRTATILAYCLMPNHYHLVVQLKTSELPESMHKLALSYAVSFNNTYQRKGHLFLGPYQRKRVNDLLYLLHLSRYIHLNPVAAKLVSRAEEWEFSSYCEYIGKRKSDFVNPTTILDMIGEGHVSRLDEKQTDYQKFMEEWEGDYMSFKLKD